MLWSLVLFLWVFCVCVCVCVSCSLSLALFLNVYLSYSGLFVFLLSYYFLEVSLYSNEKEKGFGWPGREEDLGEVMGGEIIIKNYDMGKILFLIFLK